MPNRKKNRTADKQGAADVNEQGGRRNRDEQAPTPGRRSEREGPHGERLDEQQIDADVASRTMEGERSVDEDEVQDAFRDEGQGRDRES